MATVQVYSLKKDGEKFLARNFQVKEFRCKDGSDTIKVCQETVEILQSIRDYFGKPVYIHSAYRTPSHNSRVGGTINSQHVIGTAVDFHVDSILPKYVAGYLEDNFPDHGIGLYTQRGFVHLDSRGRKVYWKNTGTNVVNSFGQGKTYASLKKKTTVETTTSPSIQTNPKKSEDKMTDKEIYEAVQRYAKAQPVPEWAKKELQEAINMGITDGKEAASMVPRYQAAIMAKRALEKGETNG